MEALLIRKTLRVPALSPETAAPGDGTAAARRLDTALLSAGFTLSADLLTHLSGFAPEAVTRLGKSVLKAVRALVGGHVEHNVYFRDFPAAVPDTMEFWLGLARELLVTPEQPLNLLELPGYGRYHHSHEEMAAAHELFLDMATDRVTVLHLGGTPDEEAAALYLALAASTVPLNAEDLYDLRLLAQTLVDAPVPEAVPVRENKAVVNRERILRGLPPLADTVTDVLRAACALSDGDVTLLEPTRFRPFRRAERRALLSALDAVVAADEDRLADVARHRERWKRLGERLHPHEHPRWPLAGEVFAVARGSRTVRTLAARIEDSLSTGDTTGALSLLGRAPGTLLRSVDRLARLGTPGLLDAVRAAAPRASGRVLLSLREHFADRAEPGGPRLFVNRDCRPWVLPDPLPPLDPGLVGELCAILDAEIAARLPRIPLLVYQPGLLDLALGLSQKGTAAGFGVLHRGSVSAVNGELLRFFAHWRESSRSTDFDLSALLLDDDFASVGWLSFTDLERYGGAHSGDIVGAPSGASEFIDVDLGRIEARYVMPQVHVYSGEGFAEVAESFFGYMERSAEQEGLPFEPRTVRVRSDVRGSGRVALPVVFARGDDGSWTARWLHLFLRGEPGFNTVEGNAAPASLMVRAELGKARLRMRYLLGLLRGNGTEVRPWDPDVPVEEPVTWVGLEVPDGLPEGSRAYGLARLGELVPE
ncbi:hypothetical protein AB0I28_06210 [Phytomonospora sp. NPDC050363]|uniref:hypothetical protein n=1 Tax=Phytomonospora sp. NPDC050363 TaxID=3155642 RepID=UPI0033FF46D3